MAGRLLFAAVLASCAAAEPAAERGRKALLERSYNPPVWALASYKQLWKAWGLSKPPAGDYDAAVRDRYGLHPAPYPNGGLPMGLREGPTLVGKGVSVDCLVCHGGSIGGQSYVGLGNASLDIQALFEDFSEVNGLGRKMPHTFCNVRGTSEAGAMGVLLLGHRNPDLSLRKKRLELGLHDDMCEDVPAWWVLKKKRTMYHTGMMSARSVRAKMQFMMVPFNSAAAFEKAEPAFRDIQEYLLSLEPPRYPLPIDKALAAKGEALFKRDCARCHGTYGPGGSYPNKVVPLDEIGTDRRRYEGIERAFGEYYNKGWFAHEEPGWLVDGGAATLSPGYQAPPLDGVWATAPYFHNGSVPTVEGVLNSAARPKAFTRSFRTDLSEYDPARLGWKVVEVKGAPRPGAPGVESRKVYDTARPGRSNGGHTYGDHLGDDERAAVIEYLKGL